jgi:hypothetical protein
MTNQNPSQPQQTKITTRNKLTTSFNNNLNPKLSFNRTSAEYTTKLKATKLRSNVANQHNINNQTTQLQNPRHLKLNHSTVSNSNENNNNNNIKH